MKINVKRSNLREKYMNPVPHTTLLELLTQPVTGDIGVITKKKIEAFDSSVIRKDAHKTATEQNNHGIEDLKDATPEEIKEGEQVYHEALAYIKDAIAPAMVKVSPHDIQVNDTFCKTLFTYAYPDFLE